MFLRKRKLPEIKVMPARKKKKKVSPKLLQQALVPVLHHLATFLPLNDFNVVSHLNNTFNLFSTQNNTWRNIYLVHFGPLYFHSNYKDQYIAEHLLRVAYDKNAFPLDYKTDLQALKNHLTKLPFQDWMNFYYAHLAKEELIDDKSPVEYSLAAVKDHDLRAVNFLINYFQENVGSLIDIKNSDIEQLLNLLLPLNADITIAKKICHVYCILYINSELEEIEKRVTLKNTSIVEFMRIINPSDTDIKSFIDFFIIIFKSLQLLSPTFIHYLTTNSKISQSTNISKLLGSYLLPSTYCSDELKNILLGITKHFRNEGNVMSSYHYAESLYLQLYPLFILSVSSFELFKNNDAIIAKFQNAKDHYLVALYGNETKAIEGLFKLTTMQGRLEHEIITEKEFETILKTGAQKGHKESILALANKYCIQKDWYKDLYKVWILQLVACDNHAKLKKVINHSFHPKSNAVIQCALTLIYAIRGDKIKSEKNFANVKLSDPTLFQRYLSAGKNFRLCTSQHFQIITDLEFLDSTPMEVIENDEPQRLRPF